MDFAISNKQQLIVAEVRRFREECLAPMEEKFLLTGALPAQERTDLELAARERGLWAMDVPVEFGGRGFDESTMCLISEELYKHPAMFNFGGSPEPCLYVGTDYQLETYLYPVIAGERRSAYAFTEPGAGTDFAGIATRAVRSGDNWTIDGRKSLIAYMDRADFVIVFASTEPSSRARGMSCFLVDRNNAGMLVSEPEDSMGDSWPTYDIVFRNCVVSDRARLGDVNGAWPIAAELLSHGRLRIAAYQLGIARRCLDIAIDHARTRLTWGRPLASRQAIQWMISDSHIELEAAQLLVRRAAWLVDRNERDRTIDLSAKLYATEMAQRATDCALQVLGGVGYSRSSPVQSFYRQVRAWRIGHGSSEISRWMVARSILGDAAAG